MFGLLVVILAVFIAISAYKIAPDGSPDANEIHEALNRKPPGFTVTFLKVRKNNDTQEVGFFNSLLSGQPNVYQLIPINSYELDGANLIYEKYEEDSSYRQFDTIKIVDVAFALSTTQPQIDISGDHLSFFTYDEKAQSKSIDELHQLIEKDHIDDFAFVLGTDQLGRDTLSRMILGVRISLSVGFISVLISLVIGIALGAIAGYYQAFPPKTSVVGAIGGGLLLIGLGYLGVYLLMCFTYVFQTIVYVFEKNYFQLLGSKAPDFWFWSLPIIAVGFATRYFARNSKRQNISIPVDDVIMWLVNMVWSIPTMLLVFAMTLVLGRGFWQVFVAVGITMWVEVARVVRGQVMGIRQQDFIRAAESLGFRDFRIIVKHVLPNIIGPVIVIAAANFASAILIEAGLSFLGLGVQKPTPSWGRMLSENYGYIIAGKAFLAIIPGLAIVMMVLAFNLLGNGLRDAFDVKTSLGSK